MPEGFKNDSFAQISHQIHAHQSFVLCGHMSPDGDCIGSQLSLYHALKALGKEVCCLLVKDDPIDEGLLFLPGIQDMIPSHEYQGTPDVFITCDVPTLDRMGKAKEVHARAKVTITLDHHASQSPISQLNYVDSSKASVTMIVWELISFLGVERGHDIALCALTGLITDTGGFRFQNADTEAFEAAGQMVRAGAEPSLISREVFQKRSLASLRLEAIALDRLFVSSGGLYILSYLSLDDFKSCQGEKPDADPIINTLRSLKGVRVACMLREQEGSVRGSIRAKDGTDVAMFAEKYHGGGHKAAAGFTVFSTLEDAVSQVKAALDSYLSEGA